MTSATDDKDRILGYEKDKSNNNPNNPIDSSEPVNAIVTNIISAIYEDSDNDGFEDDVYASISFETNFKHPKIKIYITLTLILPSGLTFYYEIEEEAQNIDLIVNFYFINHAIEPGWYELIVTAATGDMIDLGQISTDSLIFDPPGGGGGGDLSIYR
ncbi:MAG: hypothetical protein GPJ54_13015 [Candidatus Heimdallarchaeota archaeon]|nr:hypothetical protein [Candidatus Heimdallarchaeota archaeon]